MADGPVTEPADLMKQSPCVLVIGAGMVGTCCALYLQQAGHHVTLVDSGQPGSGASYGNAATFATYGCIPVNHPKLLSELPALMSGADQPLSISLPYVPRMLPWLIRFLCHCKRERVDHTIRALASLLAHAEDASLPLFRAAGAMDLIKRNGTMYLYSSEKALAAAKEDIERRRQHGVAITDLKAEQALELEPALAPVFAGGILYNDGFHLHDPQQMVSRLAKRFVADGGQLMQGEVKMIEALTSNRLNVRTQETDLQAQHVVIAAGAWSTQIASPLIEPLPLDTERGYHVMFPQDATLLTRPVGMADAGLYLSPLADGLRAAGTVELAGLHRPQNPRRLDYIERCVRRALPQAGQRGDTWLGFRPTLPDSLPVIGRSTRHSSLIYAFGHHHIGLTLGGITGRLVQQIIDDEAPVIDLTPYRPQRFND